MEKKVEKKEDRKAIFYDTGNKKLNWMLDFLGMLVFIMIAVMLFRGIFYFMFSPHQQPADMSFMLIPYSGIPFMFWMLAGFGLVFHGINIFDSHNRAIIKK